MKSLTLTESCSITHLRALAILLIIACHFLQGMGNSLAFVFNVGVQIFLIISGYLYGTKDIETKKWIKKRLVKVYMPYLVLLFILFPFLYIPPRRDNNASNNSPYH